MTDREVLETLRERIDTISVDEIREILRRHLDPTLAEVLADGTASTRQQIAANVTRRVRELQSWHAPTGVLARQLRDAREGRLPADQCAEILDHVAQLEAAHPDWRSFPV